MSRYLAFAAYFGVAGAVLALAVAACSDAELSTPSSESDASIHRDSAPVDAPDGGDMLDADLEVPAANCGDYCDSVMASCTGGNAQYASRDECIAFCQDLPLEGAASPADDKSSASVACREYWAGAPAKTSPDAYCFAAGPYGGNACGDRCTAFCQVVLTACAPDAGDAPYPDLPTCANACAGYSYRDAGTDGGGEGPSGPTTGDSLNCRLDILREAVTDPSKCADIRSGSCAD